MKKSQCIDGYRGYWIGCQYDANGDTIAFVGTNAETGAEIAHPDLDKLFEMITELTPDYWKTQGEAK